MAKGSTPVTSVWIMTYLLRNLCWTTFLEAHWKELHLSPGMDFDMLLGMLKNAQLEILSKFSVIFNQHW